MKKVVELLLHWVWICPSCKTDRYEYVDPARPDRPDQVHCGYCNKSYPTR